MPSPKGDPTYIKNKDSYFISVAKAVSESSTHPAAPGGCVIVRDREIIGNGRSLLTDCKVEIDCLCHAVATAAKNGTFTNGSVVYTTRYPFADGVFQAYIMGIRRIVILAHQWEPFYKDEFRRAARLARELAISIEPIYEDEDPRFTKNSYDREENSYQIDAYDPTDATTTIDEDTTTI